MKNKLSILVAVFFTVLLLLPQQVKAKDFSIDEVRKNLPKMLGANNVGRDFYVTFHPCWESTGGTNELKVYVSAGTKTKVTLEIPGRSFKQTKYTIPNDIIEFSLTPGQGQCYRKTDRDPPQPDQVFRGFAVHIYSDDPIICYGVTRYYATSDGFLALPVPALGKEYVCASYADPAINGSQWLTSYINVVAPYDNTRVRFTLGGNGWTTSAGGMKPGETKSWTLHQGDVLLVGSLGTHADLTGSRVVASKPVAVLSGNFCAYIPTNNAWCDFIIEQELPVESWGTEYHVTKIVERKFNSIIKIFAKEPSTLISRDGLPLGMVKNVGGIEGDGYLFMRADDGAPRPIVVSGDKPISVTQFNTGQQEDNIPSDPFQLVLTPFEQYQTEIVFNTPGIRGGYGFPKNYINIVYEATPYGTMPADLMMAEVLNGDFVWKPLVSMDPVPGDEFKVKVNNKRYFSKTVLLPHDGVYKLRANAPFAAYAYGFSYCDSYGFPTSVALGDMTKRDTIPPDPQWEMDCDGSIGVTKKATVRDLPDDAELRSNLSVIYMHSDLSFNYSFSHGDFMPGEDASTTWRLIVIDPTQDARAVITFSDRRGNDTTIVIDYFALKLALRPKLIDYGRLAVGEVKEYDFWVINESTQSPAVVNYVRLKNVELGKPQGFEIYGINLPVTIPPMDSVNFKVRFTATIEGMFKDSIGIGDTCFFWYKSYVEARVGVPIINVSDWNFGDVTVGTTAPGTIDIKNEGTVDLIITGYQGPFDFTNVYSHNLGDITEITPLKLKPKEMYTFNVTFTPDAEKDYPDSIVFISNTFKEDVDSVGVIWGRGIKSDLLANSYDWKRRRIDRPGTFDIPAYPADNNYEIVKLYNRGTKEVLIRNIKIISDVNGSAFEFARNQFVNKTILPKDSFYLPVKFHPTKTGPHELIFEYDNDAGSTTRTTLQGIGILPKVTTTDYDFDTTIVDDYPKARQHRITISNLPLTDWQYGDSVTITDLSVLPNGDEIESTIVGDIYGVEGFRFDKAAIGLPVTLQPGESLEFDAYFVAPKIYRSSASLKTKSDAEADVTTNWKGWGLIQGISVKGAGTTICVGEQQELTCRIENTGSADLIVDSLRFEPPLSEITFVNPSDPVGFAMGPGVYKDIKILYKPVIAQQSNTELVAYNNSKNQPVSQASINCSSEHYTRNTKVDPPLVNANIGKTSTISLKLDAGDDLTMADVKQIDLTLEYNPDFLKIDQAALKVGSLLEGKYAIQNPVIDDKNGRMTLSLVGSSVFNFTNGGEILRVTFGAYLPKLNSRESEVKHTVTAVGTSCLDFTMEDGKILLDSTCVYDLRKVILSSTNYALQAVSPNPVGADGANIEFAVGLNGYTEISIYNAATGELVATPVSEVLKDGTYKVYVPVTDMSSGTYVIRMKSGEFEQTEKMVIAK